MIDPEKLAAFRLALAGALASEVPAEADLEKLGRLWFALAPGDRLVTELSAADREAVRRAIAVRLGVALPRWSPGTALPRGGRGYTRREAVAAVGPGWSDLAAEAWEAVTGAGARVIQVKQKWAQIVVYFEGLAWDGPEARALWGRLDILALRSRSVCEACGAPGTPWTPRSAPAPLSGEPTAGAGRHLTLCDDCAWRFYVEGARGWGEIRGGWMPESDEDRADEVDDG